MIIFCFSDIEDATIKDSWKVASYSNVDIDNLLLLEHIVQKSRKK